MLQPIAPGVWDFNAPLCVLGLHIGHRMAFVRLADHSPWVRSPFTHDSVIAHELAVFGPVAPVGAPNAMHDTCLEAGSLRPGSATPATGKLSFAADLRRSTPRYRAH
jgi:hypothetical protein